MRRREGGGGKQIQQWSHCLARFALSLSSSSFPSRPPLLLSLALCPSSRTQGSRGRKSRNGSSSLDDARDSCPSPPSFSLSFHRPLSAALSHLSEKMDGYRALGALGNPSASHDQYRFCRFVKELTFGHLRLPSAQNGPDAVLRSRKGTYAALDAIE